jgi:AcrR family transcriptional regulator
MVATASGLRERKKQRTRERIVDVATRLFAEQGYQQTTLAQIAEEADVALSTFFNYFPNKLDIVFCPFEGVVESARRRILERPAAESALQAVSAWLSEDLPHVEIPYEGALRRYPQVISSDPELVDGQRLRLAQLEDVLAAGFARDFGESADAMRPRVLSAMALRGMIEAWDAWMEKHAGDADFHLAEALEAKAEHVQRVLEAGLALVDSLPALPD